MFRVLAAPGTNFDQNVPTSTALKVFYRHLLENLKLVTSLRNIGELSCKRDFAGIVIAVGGAYQHRA